MAAPTIWLQNQQSLFEMTSSAEWIPVTAWEKDETTGKQRPSNRQAIDSAGLGIWSIRVIGRQDIYGRPEEAFFELRVASAGKPDRGILSQLAVCA